MTRHVPVIWKLTLQAERRAEGFWGSRPQPIYAILIYMQLKYLSMKPSPLCGGDGRTGSWGRLARALAGVCMGLAAALLPCASHAGEPPRQALRLTTWLDRDACGPTPQALRLTPDVALGLVAFHSPYLFGGKALRAQLTCGACHAKDGPSGAAVRLRLRAPVPELRTAAARIDVAAFAAHAVAAEFDGPPLPLRTARALAALAGVLAPFSSEPSELCQVDATALVAIGLHLAIAQVGATDTDTDELAFLLDSLRFILGEMARGTAPGGQSDLLHETNRALHDAAFDDANSAAVLANLQGLAEQWEAASNSPHVLLVSNAVPIHE